MLIDYLRYQAFAGRLRRFFEGGSDYFKPEHSTGQHLRFSPSWIDRNFEEYGDWREHYYRGYRDYTLPRLLSRFGFSRRYDSFPSSGFVAAEKPPTYRYDDEEAPDMEIIIDIDPKHWNDGYSEGRSFEGTPIIFRRSGPARANFSAGSRIVDRNQPRSAYGTLCGVFRTGSGLDFGLTCGHVTRDGGDVLVESPRRIWRFEFGTTFAPFGTTHHRAMCGPDIKIGEVTTKLDAALIACAKPYTSSGANAGEQQAILKPISAVLQEDPVCFRGANRHRPTMAKIAAITVRKSVDLFSDGNLHSVGDVLMLGHRQHMYLTQSVSRPGDSGSAVRFGTLNDGSFYDTNQWYGMILAGDEFASYASYSECIWAWAMQNLGVRDLDFFF